MERNQRAPSIAGKITSRNAPMPKNCSIMSAVNAPTTPIQLRAACEPVRTDALFQRWVKRRIRNEREEKEERGDAHQEADQLIEPTVPGGNENVCQIIHVGRFTH